MAASIHPANAANVETTLKEAEAAARIFGLKIRVLNATTSREIDAAFATLGREGSDAILVGNDPFLNSRRVQLVHLATLYKMPASYATRDFVEAGGLMSYGADIADAWRQVGVYTGRILQGTKPADLPVVQSDKFELFINTTIARMLGLTVPASLLARTDGVIE